MQKKKEETNEKIDCSQPHHLRTRNKKRARITLGWGWGLQAKRARSPSPTQSSLPFCAGVQFSRDSIRAFNGRTKYEKIESCEQSKEEKKNYYKKRLRRILLTLKGDG